eukprot:CAMPEP_0194550224 /NCGR_PEP_ID=MMETSP0253-20130528/95604_1 /TAXON_ID=2966 /ORGANISM="Noctiluca scintillans" /LENGTH=162 /DNA_ID=CAMNT_0039397661 /DNA_START=1532 /DNA_END=2017 /DNA_ORIENTATION=-
MSLRRSQSDAWNTPANNRVVDVESSIVAHDSGWKPRLPRKAEVVDGLAWQEGVVLRRSPQAFTKTLCLHDNAVFGGTEGAALCASGGADGVAVPGHLSPLVVETDFFAPLQGLRGGRPKSVGPAPCACGFTNDAGGSSVVMYSEHSGSGGTIIMSAQAAHST